MDGASEIIIASLSTLEKIGTLAYRHVIGVDKRTGNVAVYVGVSGIVRAVNPYSGCVCWTYDPGVSTVGTDSIGVIISNDRANSLVLVHNNSYIIAPNGGGRDTITVPSGAKIFMPYADAKGNVWIGHATTSGVRVIKLTLQDDGQLTRQDIYASRTISSSAINAMPNLSPLLVDEGTGNMLIASRGFRWEINAHGTINSQVSTSRVNYDIPNGWPNNYISMTPWLFSSAGELHEKGDSYTSIANSDIAGDSFYNSKTHRLYSLSGDEIRKHRIAPVYSDKVDAAQVVSSICDRVGLKDGDIDTSSFDNETDFDGVGGFVLEDRTTAKKAIEAICRMGFIDPVERDGRLVFQRRGGSPVATLNKDEFVLERGEAYREVRQQEAEIPAVVSIGYWESSKDFERGEASYSRILSPNEAVLSDNTETFNLPMSWNATKAKRFAQRVMRDRWIGRNSVVTRLPTKYLYLDSGDVVDLELTDIDVQVRFVRADIGSDFTLQVELVYETHGEFTSSATADPGAGITPPEPVSVPMTVMFLLDAPLLVDTDEVANGHRVYFAVNGMDGWNGATVYKSADQQTWDVVSSPSAGIPYGTLNASIGNPASYWRTDKTNSIEVTMIEGQLASVSRSSMLNGANTLAIVKADGVAIVQFQDAEDLGNNRYRLTNLLRGKRGTEQLDKDYAGTESVILLTGEGTVPNLPSFTITENERSMERSYRAVTTGQLFADALTTRFTSTGVDKKEYAPSLRSSVEPGMQVFEWITRERTNGDAGWQDGGGGLISAGETFEIEYFRLGNEDNPTSITWTPNIQNGRYVYYLREAGINQSPRYGFRVRRPGGYWAEA